MKLHHKPLSQQTIVITGASSGIGLATACAAAKKGARLVLAARNESALREAVQKIKDKGGEAIYVVADVGNRADVDKIFDKAMMNYNGFDTWVNVAGVGIFGRIEDTAENDSRRLFDTNFWGVVNGSLAALKYLKTRGGALINVGSQVSDTPSPLLGIYSASKHAVKGFTDSLRLELAHEKAPVSVTLIKPAAIASPFFEHAENMMSKEPKAPSPIYAPEEVAHAILHAAVTGEREIYVGSGSKAMSVLYKGAAGTMDWVSKNILFKSIVSNKPKRTEKSSLHNAGEDGNVNGKDTGRGRVSIYTRAHTSPVITGVTAATLVLGVIGLYARKNGRQIPANKLKIKKFFRK